MSVFATIRFNWLPSPSLYQEARAWTARQQVARQQAEELGAYSDSFAATASNEASEMVKITAQIALARVQKSATAKSNSVLSSAASPSPSPSPTQPSSSGSITLRDGTVINSDPTQYLPGGSKLNLDAGTLTLSNGTVIDTRTGARKIDVTA